MSMNRLSPQQKRRRKKRIIVTCLIVALVIAAAAVGLMFLQRSITERYADEEEVGILTATVSTGSIRTTVAGSGSLANEESTEVILPANTLLDEVFVRRPDTVEAGDLLATVNTESVITAMAAEANNNGGSPKFPVTVTLQRHLDMRTGLSDGIVVEVFGLEAGTTVYYEYQDTLISPLF